MSINMNTLKQTDIGDEKIVYKRVLGVIGNVLFFCVLIIVAVVVFFTVQSKMAGGTPGIAGYKLYIVLSGSMEPELHTGSLVFVHPIDAANLAMNDIITFKALDGSEKLVTHRIVEVKQGDQLAFITKGDANDVNDPKPVLAADIVGKVSMSVPFAGYLMNFARSKMGLLVLVILPGAFIIVLEMMKLFKYVVQLDREKQEKLRAELEKKAGTEGSGSLEKV